MATTTPPTSDTSPVRDIFDSMSYGPALESDADVREWLAQHQSTFGHYINGAWTTTVGGALFDVQDPSTGRVLARAARGMQQDVDAAVAAARATLPEWQAIGGHARARWLYALARGLQRHSRHFAVLESLDNGKPIRETRDIDIPLVARHFYHHAGWAQLLESEFAGHHAYGVVGQIISRNFPLLMLAWKVAPALAAGNTIVFKPAECTPLSALRFAQFVDEIGLPPGVFNLVTGDGRTGTAIVNHPDVDKIAFTGSTDVGRAVRVATAGSGKGLSLELGGKNSIVVLEDADLDSVVEGVVDANWLNQGRVCDAGSRLLVHECIAERLYGKILSRMERLRVGEPLDNAVDMGAIVAPVQHEHSVQPVAEAMTFRTPSEAVALANNTVYGLAASVWSENINLALDIAPKLKCGVVWVNSTNLFDASAGFGGYRESGFGREGGREGMWEYLKPTHAKVDAALPVIESGKQVQDKPRREPGRMPAIDRTAKLFVGGKHVRPDSGYSRTIRDAAGAVAGEVAEGNRKDIRNAVEAAQAAMAWAKLSGHQRAQILYYIAENLSVRAAEFQTRIQQLTGNVRDASLEVECSIARLFTYAAWADKYDGAVHDVPMRAVALALQEPIGVVGVACPDPYPLLGLISLTAPLIATGNRVVVVPSERYPLLATDFYSVLETSDLPPGVLNIVTGERDSLSRVLAEHDDVDAMWYVGSHAGSTMVEKVSANNLKRTWTEWTPRDWADPRAGEGRDFLRRAVQVKNIWIPYGE